MRKKLALLTLFALAGGSAIALGDDDKKTDPSAPAGEQKSGGKGAGKGNRAKLFDKIDANGDGKLTKVEYKTFLESAKSKHQAKGKGGKAGGNAGDLAGKLFDKMDTNKDGVVTKEEFLNFDPKAAVGKAKTK